MAENKKQQPVFVTRSFLPPLDAYLDCVRDIFNSHWLTNQGQYSVRLEQSLTAFLQVPNLTLCANGTLALQLAIRLLGLNGKKVITTPFTYVATLSALLWEGCTPVFADIDPDSLCIDPHQVERLIAVHPDVAGVLPVHVYGNACDVDALESLSRKNGLSLLYDAAHAFGSSLRGRSLFTWGDAAAASFHATKLFHTVEGGCVITPNAADKEKLSLLRAFGHTSDAHKCLGINAKMSELHAAMGLCLLPGVPDMLAQRAKKATLYDTALGLKKDSCLRKPCFAAELSWNHAYYPVIFPDHASLMATINALKEHHIYPRRYFYPCLTMLPYVSSPPCPIAEDMAQRVLCLPFWPGMEERLICDIATIVRGALA